MSQLDRTVAAALEKLLPLHPFVKKKPLEIFPHV